MATKPASEAQLAYLGDLTAPERLAALSAAEARYLIAWLVGPPPNASRAQQLYLAALLERLPRDRLSALIGDLVAEAERPADTAPSSPPPQPTQPTQPKRRPQHTTRPWNPQPEAADLDRLF